VEYADSRAVPRHTRKRSAKEGWHRLVIVSKPVAQLENPLLVAYFVPMWGMPEYDYDA